jgi:hypothetical protein
MIRSSVMTFHVQKVPGGWSGGADTGDLCSSDC